MFFRACDLLCMYLGKTEFANKGILMRTRYACWHVHCTGLGNSNGDQFEHLSNNSLSLCVSVALSACLSIYLSLSLSLAVSGPHNLGAEVTREVLEHSVRNKVKGIAWLCFLERECPQD